MIPLKRKAVAPPIDPALPSPRLTVVEHLEEVRWRLAVCVGCLFVFSIAAYFFSDALLEFFLRPIRELNHPVYFLSIPEAFLVKLKVSLLAGFLASFPVLTYQAWAFLSPGLYEREKGLVAGVLAVGFFLFIGGALLAFYLIVPVALRFLLGFQGATLQPLISVGHYISFVGGMILAFGLAFDLPVVLVGWVRAGWIRTQTLRRSRPYIIVGIFIAAAVLTPSPDVASQLLLAIPLWGLFEGCLLFARWVEPRRPLPSP